MDVVLSGSLGGATEPDKLFLSHAVTDGAPPFKLFFLKKENLIVNPQKIPDMNCGWLTARMNEVHSVQQELCSCLWRSL